MYNKLKKFYSLNSLQKRLLFRAYFLLGVMRFLLLSRQFKQLVGDLAIDRQGEAQGCISPKQLDLAREVGLAVRTAARFTPWNSNCLTQVMVAQRLLQQYAIAGAFYIGATLQPEPPGEARMAAHAWLKCGDLFITGEPGYEQYTVVSSFSWK